jgi:NDP-sugar pyrophosphorylase family protein
VKALLLAAGEGRRLRPLTSDRPKPMVRVAGVPMIAYVLQWLRANGITEVAINTHYKPESLVSFVGDGSVFGVAAVVSEEPRLLGSAGALAPLRSYFSGEDRFIVVYGDVLTDIPLGPVLVEHATSGADATVVLSEVDDPGRVGMVELDELGWIRRLVEKPASWGALTGWANGGIYVLGPKIWQFLRGNGCRDFAFDVFPAMLSAGARIRGFPSRDILIDIGSHERLAAASALVESGRLSRPRIPASC